MNKIRRFRFDSTIEKQMNIFSSLSCGDIIYAKSLSEDMWCIGWKTKNNMEQINTKSLYYGLQLAILSADSKIV